MTRKFTSITRNYTQRFIGKKQTQIFLHINSEHPISSKKSIPFSQVLRVKCTCSAVKNFKLYPSERKKIIEKGYKSELDKHILAIEKLDRNEMLKEKVREKPKQTCIPPTLTYNRFCPNIST